MEDSELRVTLARIESKLDELIRITRGELLPSDYRLPTLTSGLQTWNANSQDQQAELERRAHRPSQP